MTMKIRKGDTVRIIAGKYQYKVVTDEKDPKAAPKRVPFEGKVTQVNTAKETVIIEGANLVKRHLKKQGSTPGQIITREKPIPVSNVMLICPHTKEPTRVGIERKDGKKIRVSKKAGKPIN